jgi:hypothetical protein
VTYKIAGSRAEREAAFRLVYDGYVQAGLMQPNSFQMRVTPYHLLPTTDIFIAQSQGEVLCTVTLVGDGELGIPMEAIYPKEVESLRDQHRHFGELSCLADRKQASAHVVSVLTNLNGLICQYAKHHGMHQLMIAIHPTHARFYKRLFGYKQIGAEKSYPMVGDKPAVAATHDFARMEVERYPMFEQSYAHKYTAWELLPRPMLEEDRDYFRAAAECGSAFIPVAAA